MPLKLPFDFLGHEVKGKPLLKWPGGKRSLLKHIFPLLPQDFNRYYEPFVGGGALFFALQPKLGLLSDCNNDLINCYSQVRDKPNEVIAQLKMLKNTEENYYRIRDEVPTDDIARAARLIYLTTLSFNGIYRINSAGKFNVPYGHRLHLQPPDIERILAVSQALQGTTLKCGDFEVAVKDAKEGDLVYLEPAYTVAHGNNGFLI